MELAARLYDLHKPTFAPDWKTNFKKEWSREEIDALVTKELGRDVVAMTRFWCLVKIYKMSESVGGILITEEQIYDGQLNDSVGLLLDHGDDAFKDPERYPSGATHFRGQWYRFDKVNCSRFPINGHLVAVLS